MRKAQFVAQHRGGLLSIEDHRQLMKWALSMTEHLVPYLCAPIDPLIIGALDVGKKWSEGCVGTGQAIKLSRAVHTFARSVEDPAYKLFCRSVGQAVATAHMADHSLGPIYYGQKLMNLLHLDAAKELSWQLASLHELCPKLVSTVIEALPSLL